MTGTEAVIRHLGKDWDKVSALMRDSLKSDIGLLDSTNESILAHGGKMLRPMLSLLVAKACNGGVATEDSVRFAAATEMLHDSTLLHDDVVDGSTQRRGHPTVSARLGGTASVLVGDYWLVRAVRLILDSASNSEEVIRLFAKTLGDLAEGELLQMQKAEAGDTSREDYMRIIYSKTASLFEAACVSAVISVGGDPSLKEAARQYGICIGLAFQIKDDILDYDGTGLGKPTGMDIKERKITLPLLGALSRMDDERDRLVRGMVCDIHGHPEYVDRIVDLVHGCDGIRYAESVLAEFVAKAVSSIGVLPDGPEKSMLVDMAGYVAGRKS